MKFEPGKTYLRTRPILNGFGEFDYSFCSDPIRYLGEEKGMTLFCYPKGTVKGNFLGDGPRILPTAFNDSHWESLFDVMNGDEWTALDYFLTGKKIYRKSPLKLSSHMEELSFNFSFDVAGIEIIKLDTRFVGPENAVTLIASTKHHVVVEMDEKTIFLDERFTNPEDWKVLD